MSIASEITRLQNSKADVKTQVNIDKDLINNGTAFIDDETVDDYDDKIEEMQEAYKKFIPIQSESGTTEVTIDNTGDTKALTSIGIDGNIEQYTTTGKNLLDESTLRQGSGADSSSTARVFIPGNYYLETGTYTVYTNLNTSTYKYAVGIASSAFPFSGTYLYDSGWQTTDHFTFTINQRGYLGLGMAKSDGASAISPSDVSGYYFMVVKGSYDSSTAYESYTGGIASPNPSFPQSVNVVTGDNNVVVRGRNINSTTTRVGLYLIVDGTYSSTTTSYITVGDLIPLDYNKTITVSNEKSKSGSWYMLEYDKDKNYLNQNQLLTGTTATFTTQNPLTKYIAIDLGGGINLENAGEIMIETGSTAHSYEPYIAPTSYPINLKSKNLLDESTIQEGTYNGFVSGIRCFYCSNYYLKPGTYTLITNIDENSDFRYSIVTSENIFPTNTTKFDSSWKQLSSFTFTLTSSNEGYLGIIMSRKNGTDAIQVSDLADVKIMVYEGSYDDTITYEPYLNIELAQIGTYIDKLYRDNTDGKWYKYNAIKKSTLGSDITFLSTTGGFYSATATDYATSGNTPYCEWYQGKNNTAAINGITDKEIAFNTSSSPYPRLYLKDSNYSSNTTLNSDLSANQVHIYYALATPTITEITNTTLINQLEAIHLATGTNVIEFDGDTLVSGLDINYIGEASPHL